MESQHKLQLTTLALLFSFTTQTVWVNEASAQNRPIHGFRPQATAQLPSYRYDDYDLEKYENLSRDADRRLTEAQRAYEIINRDYTQAVEREQRINQNLQTAGRKLETLKRTEQELTRAIQQNQQTISQSEQAVPKLKSEGESLQNQVNSTQKVVDDLKAKLAAATTDAEKAEIQKQIDAQAQVLNTLKGQLTSKQRELAQMEARLTEARNALTQNGRKLEENKREAQSTQTQIADLQRQQETARRESLERQRARDLASNEVQSRSREVETTRRNLDQIRRNIQIARSVLEDQATEQAMMDAGREGSELGIERGSRDGRDRGTIDGRSNGINDGRKRDYNSGYASGKDRATQEALANSERDAQTNGSRDGLAQGKIDGLKNAYNVGMQEGLKHGAETGSDREAYAIGRKEGEAAGLAKAVEDAKPQEGLGYKDKENEYLAAPLKKVVVGDANLAQKFEGLQGRFSEEGDDRYYRPQPGVLPHRRLEPFYMEAYDRTYRKELSETYRSVYRREYDVNYTSYYRQNYDSNFNVKYPDSEKSGYDQGYKDTYQRQYDANYQVRYAAIYRTNYDSNYEKFKLDVAERARGFKDGNRTASKAKGYDEGYRASYAANIDIEKRKAYAAGQARAKNLYDNNPVIQVLSLDLKEVDADGINRPGESLAVVMKMKNFGLKAKADLNSEILEAAGGISVAQARVVTGTVPPQSEATVVVPVQSSVAKSAVDGASLAVTLRATSGQTVHAVDRKTLAIQFPAKVTVTGFDGILIPGVATPVKVRVQNRSKSLQSLLLTVSVDGSKVDIAQTQFTVAQLQPQSQQEISLLLTGKMEARFEESPLEITTVQAQDAFAMDEKMQMTIIRKHSPSADSKGLILSSNLAQGAGKKLFAIDKLDTWDLRVDGSVSDLTKIDSYQTKVIHVLADANAPVDAATVNTLKQFINKNGTVVVWGGQLDRSQLGQAVLNQVGVSVTQNQALNGAVGGIEKLRGLNMNYRGDVSVLRHNSQKGSYALNSSVGVPGVIVFGNAIEERTGQTVIIGLDMLGLEDASVKALMTQVDVLRSSFDDKMKTAASQPTAQMHLVVQDIVDEMVGAELLGTGNFYKNNSERNKIFRAGRKMIGDAGRNSAQARELAKAYPQLMDVVEKRLNKEKWRAELVIEKRHGGGFNSRNMKDLYCASNSGNQLCQSNR